MKPCTCGCGKPAPIAKRNNARYGWIKGEPKRYILGHNPAVNKKPVKYVINKDTGCWDWLLAKFSNGYGQYWTAKGNRIAHRVMYEQSKGKIADNMVLDHLCRNRACVNPAHLEPVTQAENLRRGRNHLEASA